MAGTPYIGEPHIAPAPSIGPALPGPLVVVGGTTTGARQALTKRFGGSFHTAPLDILQHQ